MVVAKTIILQCIFTQQKVQKDKMVVVKMSCAVVLIVLDIGRSARRRPTGYFKEVVAGARCVAPSGAASRFSMAARRDGARSSTMPSSLHAWSWRTWTGSSRPVRVLPMTLAWSIPPAKSSGPEWRAARLSVGGSKALNRRRRGELMVVEADEKVGHNQAHGDGGW
jgi:hypothetical protein